MLMLLTAKAAGQTTPTSHSQAPGLLHSPKRHTHFPQARAMPTLRRHAPRPLHAGTPHTRSTQPSATPNLSKHAPHPLHTAKRHTHFTQPSPTPTTHNQAPHPLHTTKRHTHYTQPSAMPTSRSGAHLSSMWCTQLSCRYSRRAWAARRSSRACCLRARSYVRAQQGQGMGSAPAMAHLGTAAAPAASPKHPPQRQLTHSTFSSISRQPHQQFQPWPGAPPSCPARHALHALALRPHNLRAASQHQMRGIPTQYALRPHTICAASPNNVHCAQQTHCCVLACK